MWLKFINGIEILMLLNIIKEFTIQQSQTRLNFIHQALMGPIY